MVIRRKKEQKINPYKNPRVGKRFEVILFAGEKRLCSCQLKVVEERRYEVLQSSHAHKLNKPIKCRHGVESVAKFVLRDVIAQFKKDYEGVDSKNDLVTEIITLPPKNKDVKK